MFFIPSSCVLPSELQATGNALTSLYEEFSSFLDSSKRFFLDLVKALYMELYQSSPPAEHLSPEVQAEARNALSKMLVFLGDLGLYPCFC